MIDCSIRVVTVLLGYLDLLIATSWGPIFGIWGPPKSWGPRRLPTLPTPKAGPVYTVCLFTKNNKQEITMDLLHTCIFAALPLYNLKMLFFQPIIFVGKDFSNLEGKESTSENAIARDILGLTIVELAPNALHCVSFHYKVVLCCTV